MINQKINNCKVFSLLLFIVCISSLLGACSTERKILCSKTNSIKIKDSLQYKEGSWITYQNNHYQSAFYKKGSVIKTEILMLVPTDTTLKKGIVIITDSVGLKIYKVKSFAKNGPYKLFYKKGNMLIANYKDNQLNGLYRYTDKDGEFLFEKEYVNGKQVRFRSSGIRFR